MNKHNKLIAFAFTSLGVWGGLGFYRGCQDYKNEYKRDYKRYIDRRNSGLTITKYHKAQAHYYYLSALGHGTAFMFGYFILSPMFVVKELYNLERAIRGIEDQDEDD